MYVLRICYSAIVIYTHLSVNSRFWFVVCLAVEMSIVNGSNHQSPRAAALAARKLLDPVGEEHSDTNETSSSSDILYSLDTRKVNNVASYIHASDSIGKGTTVGPGISIH
jgi:hypothetical protein